MTKTDPQNDTDLHNARLKLLQCYPEWMQLHQWYIDTFDRVSEISGHRASGEPPLLLNRGSGGFEYWPRHTPV